MKRRHLLIGALAVLGLLAGCSAPGSIDMQAVNDAQLAEGASRSVDSLSSDQRRSERSPRAVGRSAITNGSTTVAARSPPIDGELPFGYDGAYYNLSRTVVDRRTATSVSISVDYNTTTANGTAIAYEDLPAADREALDGLFPPRTSRRTDGYDYGTASVYTDEELNSSVLVGDQQYDAVVVDGQRYAIGVDEPRDVTVKTYRYESTRVAPSDEVYATQLRERYAFTLTNLSDGERGVVEEAVGNETYYAESEDDAAFESVLERFRDSDAIVEDQASGTWLVRYEGQLYLADLHYGGFLGE